jgi:ABC-type dipeptide/oligopeptide/nickel transport system ATPase component
MSIEFPNKSQSLLAINNLSLQSTRFDTVETIVTDISFQIDMGSRVGLVGESGSGKTLSALAVLDILPTEIQKSSGSIYYQGNLVSAERMPTFRSLRGREIAIIFQDAVAALNPVFQVGRQINDIIRCHFPVSRGEAKTLTLDQFHNVGLSETQKIYRCYPHELSGGMAQRVMIAMALCCQPKLIIADEPTTALDVKTQLQIIRLLKYLQHKHNFSLLLITHDIQLVSDMVEYVLVLYKGKIVEQGLMQDVLHHPQHEYTKLLLSAGLVGNKMKKTSKILQEE